MADSAFPSRIKHIQDGEPVNAGVASRPDRELEARSNYLRQRLDAAELGRAIVDSDVSLAADVLVGEAVYYNAANARYERALAAVENDAESGTLVPKASADVRGVVLAKVNATLGHVVLAGRVTLDISDAVSGDVEAGHYYLSAASPGKLTRQRPPVSVSVLYSNGAGDVFVQPHQRDFLEDHIHYKFELEWQPAGTVWPREDEPQTIEDADSSLPGWLPADDASFNERAPAGAAYGYNLAAHPALEAVWPPIPLEAVSLDWHRQLTWVGLNGDENTPELFVGAGLTGIPLGADGLVQITNDGIWWMSNALHATPWPADFDNRTGSDSSSVVSSSSSAGSEGGADPDNSYHRPATVQINNMTGTISQIDEEIYNPSLDADGTDMNTNAPTSLLSFICDNLTGHIGRTPVLVRAHALIRLTDLPGSATVLLGVSVEDTSGILVDLSPQVEVQDQLIEDEWVWATADLVPLETRAITNGLSIVGVVLGGGSAAYDLEAFYVEIFYEEEETPVESSVSVNPTVIPYPSDLHKILLQFGKMVFATDKTVVTSLRPAAGAPLTITCNGEEAVTGDLEIDLALDFAVNPAETAGAQVLKDFSDGEFSRGYVTEGLRAGAGVTLTSTNEREDADGTIHRGIVTVDVDTDPAERELAPQIIVLGDAKERLEEDVPFIGFPANRISAVRLRFAIPALGLPTNPRLRLRTVLSGDATGTLPLLTVTCRKLPRANSGQVAIPDEGDEEAVVFLSNAAITADNYIEREGGPIVVTAGDTILVTIQRGTGDGYAGEVGLLRVGGILVGA